MKFYFSYILGLLFFFATGSSEGILSARGLTQGEHLRTVFSTSNQDVHQAAGLEKHVHVIEVSEEEEEVHHSRSVLGKAFSSVFKINFKSRLFISKLYGYFVTEKITNSVPIYILLQVFRI